ncbi:MAG: M20/M25/M40 family metallo-hydrolase [Pseudomonadota bacterium]
MSPVRSIIPMLAGLALFGCAPTAETGAGDAAGEAQPVADLRILSADDMQGRQVGTPGNARARDYLEARYGEIGLEMIGDSYSHGFDFSRRIDFRDPDSERVQMHGLNVIGMIEGSSDSDAVIVVTAHYDHLGPGDGEIFNGADDNASGVAAILAVGEALMQAPPLHDVMIVAFDAEEGGLNGARAFVESPPVEVGRIAFNLNLDMLGYSPDGDLWAVGGYHYPVLEPLISELATRAPVELKMGFDRPTEDRRNDWTLLSDHAPFHLAGIPFVYLGVEDHEHYHQVSDEFETIPLDFFLGAVETSVMMVRAVDAELANITAAPSRAALEAAGE